MVVFIKYRVMKYCKYILYILQSQLINKIKLQTKSFINQLYTRYIKIRQNITHNTTKWHLIENLKIKLQLIKFNLNRSQSTECIFCYSFALKLHLQIVSKIADNVIERNMKCS